MVISTWNLRHGGGKRIKAIIHSIGLNSKTDLFVFTEYRNNTNKDIIKKELTNLGYHFLYSTNSEPKENSVLIASKIALQFNLFEELGINRQRILQVQTDDLIIYGCYFPIKNLKKPLFDFLLKEIKKPTDKKIILTGDFNTGKHFLDEKGKSFILSEYLSEFENHNMVDAWRSLHRDKREFSWFSHSNNGFRLDHFFVSKDLKIDACYYTHTYREEKISDHSMMTLVIK